MNTKQISIVEDIGKLREITVKLSKDMFTNKQEFEMFNSEMYDLSEYIGPLDIRTDNNEKMWVFDLTNMKFYYANKEMENKLKENGNEVITLYSPETKTMYMDNNGNVIIKHFIDTNEMDKYEKMLLEHINRSKELNELGL